MWLVWCLGCRGPAVTRVTAGEAGRPPPVARVEPVVAAVPAGKLAPEATAPQFTPGGTCMSVRKGTGPLAQPVRAVPPASNYQLQPSPVSAAVAGARVDVDASMMHDLDL